MRHAGTTVYDLMDLYRRQFGMSLDTFGVCPVETPSRVVLSRRLFNVKAYGNGKEGPALILIPAPIKQSYLWDLIPEVSVVRKCLSSGIRPYMLQWRSPGDSDQDTGLSEYADTFILESIEAIRKEAGIQRAFAAGHSLGGTLAAIFSSIHPDLLQGLITLGAPMHFGVDAGVFAPMVAAAPSSREIAARLGNIPGTFLDAVSYAAAPDIFGLSRWMDWLLSLSDREAMKIHFCVERWTLDEMPLARRLFEDIVELLYRDDRFMRGSLVINGKQAIPNREEAPLLTVADSHCPVVPARSILPFHEAAGTSDKRVLWYEGETGVALRHAGLLAGRKAHRMLWPEILKWIHEHSPVTNPQDTDERRKGGLRSK